MRTLTRFYVIVFAMFFATEAIAQTPTLLQDINTLEWTYPKHGLATADARAVFAVRSYDGGLQLWSSGFEGGDSEILTTLESPPNGLLSVGDRVIFDPTPNAVASVWVTDGTVESLNFAGSTGGAGPLLPQTLGDLILFWAVSGEQEQLWVTDGTEGSVEILLSEDVGPYPPELVPHQGRLFFALSGCRIWATDGTITGTEVPFEVDTSSLNRRENCTVVEGPGDSLVVTTRPDFGAAWLTDGTQEGTVGANYLVGQEYERSDSGVFFSREGQLWFSDGSEEGTVYVENLSVRDPPVFDAFGSTLVFSPDALEIWASDGTPEGTEQWYEPGENLTRIDQSATRVYFRSGDEVWQTDGTRGGTRSVVSVAGAEALIQPFRAAADGYVYWRDDALYFDSDSLDEATRIWPDEVIEHSLDSSPSGFREIAGRLHFEVRAGSRYSWKTDGTPGGTGHSSFPLDELEWFGPLDDVYLFVKDGDFWTTAGDFEDASPLRDLRSESDVEEFFSVSRTPVLGPSSYLVERSYVFEPGTTHFRVSSLFEDRIVDLAEFSVSDEIPSEREYSAFVHDDGRLEIVTESCERVVVYPDGGVESAQGPPCGRAAPVEMDGYRLQIEPEGVWRTDEDGRTLIHSQDGDPSYSERAVFPGGPYVVGTHAYFVIMDSNVGELWITDGTARGTELVSGGIPSVTLDYPPKFMAVSDAMLFVFGDGTGDEFWLRSHRPGEEPETLTPDGGATGALELRGEAPHFAVTNQRVVYAGRHPRLGIEPFAIEFQYDESLDEDDEDWEVSEPDDSDELEERPTTTSNGCGCASANGMRDVSWVITMLALMFCRLRLRRGRAAQVRARS